MFEQVVRLRKVQGNKPADQIRQQHDEQELSIVEGRFEVAAVWLVRPDKRIDQDCRDEQQVFYDLFSVVFVEFFAWTESRPFRSGRRLGSDFWLVGLIVPIVVIASVFIVHKLLLSEPLLLLEVRVLAWVLLVWWDHVRRLLDRVMELVWMLIRWLLIGRVAIWVVVELAIDRR